ncbi:MAG: photosynthetic complex assembly protein PuhC [Pseudomonadota bacterium]
MTEQTLHREIRDRQPPRDKEKIPRILLSAILALVLITLAMVTIARVTGMEPVSQFPDVPIVKERTILIHGSTSGHATVLDADGTLIADLGPDEGGFVAGIWRSLERKRKPYGIEGSAPVRLVRFSDGRLGLRDDRTGWRVELIGFGKDNTAIFARLLDG